MPVRLVNTGDESAPPLFAADTPTAEFRRVTGAAVEEEAHLEEGDGREPEREHGERARRRGDECGNHREEEVDGSADLPPPPRSLTRRST